MDGFRIKETRDVLTLEEMQERVQIVDEFFDIIEVYKLCLYIFGIIIINSSLYWRLENVSWGEIN